MLVRYVEETDPLRQALLEIYVSIVLATPFNDFNMHSYDQALLEHVEPDGVIGALRATPQERQPADEELEGVRSRVRVPPSKERDATLSKPAGGSGKSAPFGGRTAIISIRDCAIVGLCLVWAQFWAQSAVCS